MQAWAVSLLAVPLALAGCTVDAATSLGAQDWHDQLAATPQAFLLDVRTPDEYAQGHIAGATLIPLQSLQGTEAELPADHDAPIFVYCRSGNRSAQAASILADNGYTDVRNLAGGLQAWQDAGYPVEA